VTLEEKLIQFIRNKIKDTVYQNHVWLAGGYVRDELMGNVPKDIDLLIDLPDGGIEFAEWITKEVGCFVDSSNPVVFPKFGTAKFNLWGTEFNDIPIECVMSRAEKYEPSSRKPDVEFATLRDDVLRRDLTINALLKSVSTGEILDLTHMGIEDIELGICRTPLDPDVTFKDDPLRMLRAIRFATKYNFDITNPVWESMKRNTKSLEFISSERIQDELNKILLTNLVGEGFELLLLSGLLGVVIPELTLLCGLTQNKYHAFTAWTHTMLTVNNAEKNLVTRWASLLHDIGKFNTVSDTDTGRHFYEHHKVGALIGEKILRRLKFSNEFIESVVFIIRNHMRLKDVKSDGSGISDKSLRRLRHHANGNLDNLLDLMNADNISHGTDYDNPEIIKSIRKRFKSLGDVSVKPKLPVTGFQIMEEFNLTPGIEVGRLLGLVTEMWYENPDIASTEVIETLKRSISNETI